MKKYILVTLCLLGFAVFGSTALAEINPEHQEKFSNYVENRTKGLENYYDENSVKILKSLQMDGTVYKLVTQDDPATPEDETVTEEYQSGIVAAVIDYQLKRDTLFKFDKQEIVFYGVDKDEQLSLSNVEQNEELSNFYNEYSGTLHTKMQPFSTALIFFLIFTFIVALPVGVMFLKEKQYSTGIPERFLKDRKTAHY
ncbi:hypothetical protein ACOI1C_12535 [Bacillus sp. DJP31]|uniref:hypothetical protein n=1 Tax=Bacillus sp. DJP31 TaxID=3409789 RepID=UPI003BB53D0D